MVKIGAASKLLGVSIPTLRRWAKSGELVPTYVSGKGTRYYDLKNLITEDRPLHEVSTKALLFELLRRAAATDQIGT